MVLANSETHIKNFVEYLQIPSVQPNPDYASIKAFLIKMANELGLEYKVYEYVAGKPVVIITWVGKYPELPSVLFNSHTDVVPVYPDKWERDPFSAEIDSEGNIYARGSQDMKCVGMGYIEAFRVLRSNGTFTPDRTLHLCFVPDEEIGGHDGMEKFVASAEFKALNVGFALDEGLTSPNDGFFCFYGERAPWWLKITATGVTGHGSGIPKNTATLSLLNVLQKFANFREHERQRLEYGKLENGAPLNIGDVTSVNINILGGGVQMNVIPSEVSAGIDIRVTPFADLKKFVAMIDEFCKSEEGVTWEAVQSWEDQTLVSLPPSANATTFVQNLFNAHKEHFGDIKLLPGIFPASTDARYLRRAGIPSLGLTPVRNTPILAHAHNEFVNQKEFLLSVEWYAKVIPSIAKK